MSQIPYSVINDAVVRALNERIAKLTKEADDLRARNINQTESVEQAREERDKARVDAASLREVLQAYEKETAALHEARSGVSILRSQLRDANTMNANLHTEAARLRKENAELLDDTGALQKQLTQAYGVNGDLHMKKVKLLGELAVAKRSLELSREASELYRVEAHVALAEVERLREAIDAAQFELSEGLKDD